MKKMLLMFMVSLFVMSCSRIPEEREVTASGVEVSGFIKDYIEVVDGSYKFTNNGEEARITVKLKLKGQPTEAYHETSFPKIRINAVGADGEIFDTGVYGFEAGDKEFDKVKDLLANGKVGDTKSISFTWKYLGQDEDLGARIFKEATTFELIDAGFATGEEPEKSTSVEEETEGTEEGEDYDAITEEHRMNELADEGSTASPAPKSSIDYDKWLDEYEEYFNTMSKFYKKIKNGDQSAYADYAKALQKFNSLTDKLHGVETDMTTSQIMRMSRIIQKFSQEMQR